MNELITSIMASAIKLLQAAGLSREQILQHVTGVLDGYAAQKAAGDERMRAAWKDYAASLFERSPDYTPTPAGAAGFFAGWRAALAASAPGSEQLYEDAENGAG